jgi:hypothetical protein
MNDDQLLLASAYLDDDVDDAARAQAEADPDVMAEVARLRRTRAVLRDVDPPDPRRREQALAAALAATEPSAAGSRATRTVPPPSRRRAWWGGALAAAAALVVVVAAAVAPRGGGSEDDESAAVATEALTDAESARDATAAAPAPAAADQAGGADATGGPAATAAAGAGNDDTSSAPQIAGVSPELSTPADLVAYARRATGSAGSSGAPTCAVDGTFVGPASYRGTPVEVFVEGALVTAVDASSCDVVERVEP